MQTLSKKEAINFLGLDEKIFENYFKNALEFDALERPNGRGFFKFDEDVLRAWKADFDARTVILTIDDYVMALDFALAQHFRSYVQSDFGTGRQREFGQKITNWVKGQLGEIAVKKFFRDKYRVEITLDFDLHDDIVPQDIIGVREKGAERKPNVGIGIKASKPKNAYLILGENEIELEDRRSDAYIYTRPDIPDDHLLRVTKDQIVSLVQNQKHFSSYQSSIPDFEPIKCEIAGWCYSNELEKVSSIPGQDFDGYRFVRPSGKLRKSHEEWLMLTQLL